MNLIVFLSLKTALIPFSRLLPTLNIMGRDSRSRSRRDTQHRRHNHHSRRRSQSHRRHQSRGHEPRRRESGARSGVDVSDLSASWNPTSSHFDTNKEYGIPFPRLIESTQWTRRQQIAGIPVEQITLVDVVPKGIQNYGLRLLANGRYVAFEMFRTRLDALIASTLSKEFYRQKDSFDVQKILEHFSPANSDMNDWTVKTEAIKTMCENIISHLMQYMPQETDQALLTQIEELRRQNAELTAQCQNQTANPSNPPLAPPDKSASKPAGIQSFFPPPSGPSPPVPSPPIKQDALHSYCRPEGSAAAFGTHPPEGYGKAKIDAWIRKFVPKNKHSEVDKLCQEMIDTYKSCEVGDQPNVEAILTEWRLTSQILSKAPIASQLRLLAAVQHIKQQ